MFADGQIVGGNQLDRALWEAPDADAARAAELHRLAALPFDYERQLSSVLVEAPGGKREIIVKGAPETVLARCRDVRARRRPC